MVHALEIVRNLLRPGGTLIDIHPSGKPPPIYAHQAGVRYYLGSLQETDDFIEYFQASQALALVVAQGLYEHVEESSFSFSTLASSMAELKSYLSNNWADAVLNPDISAKAKFFHQTSDSKVDDRFTIEIEETVSIKKLRKPARGVLGACPPTLI